MKPLKVLAVALLYGSVFLMFFLIGALIAKADERAPGDQWCQSVAQMSKAVMTARQNGYSMADSQLEIIDIGKRRGVYFQSALSRLLKKAHTYPVEVLPDAKKRLIEDFAQVERAECRREKPAIEEPEVFCKAIELDAVEVMDRTNLGESPVLGYLRANRIPDPQLRNYVNETVTLANQWPEATDPQQFAAWRGEQCLKAVGGLK